MSDALRIRGGQPLRGRVTLPADLTVAQSALLFAALGTGESRLQGVPRCALIDTALAAWSELGVPCSYADGDVVVRGVGLRGLSAPRGMLQCGRSPQLLAQLAAVVSAQAFGTRLLVHPTLARLPIDDLVGLLRARGANIAGTSNPVASGLVPPIAIAPLVPPETLHALDATLPRADRDTKLAALISGFYASGATTLSEPNLSGDHVEHLCVALGLPLRRIGSVVSFEPDGRTPALGSITLPGSAALAGHFACLAQLLPNSDLLLHDASVNPSESAAIDMLRSWSATALTITPKGDAALREPIADVHVRTAAVRGGVVGVELLARASETLPALALLGLAARRGVRLCELEWLGGRSDAEARALDAVFGAFDVTIERTPGELFVAPRAAPPRAVRQANSQDDPELALLACTLALATPGETVVEHAATALAAVHPGFIPAARQLGASIELA